MIELADSPVAIFAYEGEFYEIYTPGLGRGPWQSGVLSKDGRSVGILREARGYMNTSQLLDKAFDLLNNM